MRDHRKLLAFQRADELAVAVYALTRSFPDIERFGLISQLRRGAVSVPSNIVEGCARQSQADFVRFLDIAFGSLRELQYQLDLSKRLAMADSDEFDECERLCATTSKLLHGLIQSLRPN